MIVVVSAGLQGLSRLVILDLPVLLLVGLLNREETDLELLLTLDPVHGEGTTVLAADDLVCAVLSGDWDELPSGLGLGGLLERLSDNTILSAGNDHLLLITFLLVEGKTVVAGSVALLGNKDLVPSLVGVLVVSDDGGLAYPAASFLSIAAVIENLLVVLVFNMNLALASEEGTSTGSMGCGDTLLLNVVPELASGTFSLTPHAFALVTVEIFGAIALGSGSVSDIFLVAASVLGWVFLLVVSVRGRSIGTPSAVGRSQSRNSAFLR